MSVLGYKKSATVGFQERVVKVPSLIALHLTAQLKLYHDGKDMHSSRESYSCFLPCFMDLGKKVEAIYRL